MQSEIKGQCHCGKIDIEISHSPEFINDCNCSLCRSSGALWGYYSACNVQIKGDTKSYGRADKASPAVQIHFCQSCGSTTHWTLTENYTEPSAMCGHMGVNMRLFDEDKLSGVELRFPDGKNWSGQGEYTYRKRAVILA